MADRNKRLTGNQGTQQDGPDEGSLAFNATNVASLGPFPFDLSDGTLAAPSDAAKASPGQYQQIVFIEGNVPDARLLAAGVAPGTLAVILNPNGAGVAQIAAFLTNHDITGLTSIDIVAHGADGMVQLGTGTLSSATLAQYQAELSAIGAALLPSGDIQIYGCDVGQDAAGVAFLDQLSAATGGASIAASSHLVGAAADGGNWTLDVNVGNAAVTVPFTAAAEAAYPDVLATSTDQLFVNYFANNSFNPAGTRVEQLGVSNTGTFVSGSTVDIVDQSHFGALAVPEGLAIDAPLKKYFVVNDDAATVNEILVGAFGGGNPTVLYNPGIQNAGNGNYQEIYGLTLDQPGGELYFTQDDFDSSGNNIPAGNGIYKISVGGGPSHARGFGGVLSDFAVVGRG